MSSDHGPIIQKSIPEIATYLKNLVPESIPNTYKLNPIVGTVASEEDIRSGVVAYRDFLYNLCDHLISDGDSYFQLKKKPKSETDYPFLCGLADLLSDIGYHSALSKNGDALVLSALPSFTAWYDANGKKKSPKNSAVMLTKCLRFLALCGFVFNGIDVKAKKVQITEGQVIEVSYPTVPIMLTGLKVMSVADIELRIKRYKNDNNRDNLLRCDYRLLQAETIDAYDALRDFLQPLPKAVQTFALDLHKHHMDLGMTCAPIISTFEIHFAYANTKKSKRKLTTRDIYQKRLWAFSLSARHGYCFVMRAKKMKKYQDLIADFPESLQKQIEKGYGCDRKLHNEPCQNGCQGIRLPLDDSTARVSKHIETWLDQEV